MAGDEGFIEHLKELFESTGAVVFRRMFGGYGLFREGLMFGLVADNTLYLKADDENRPGFEARGLGPFIYTSARGEFSMSYYRAPDEAVDNSRDLAPWAHSAFSAAQRAAAGKSKKKSSKKSESTRSGNSGKKTGKSAAKKPVKKTASKKTAKKAPAKKTSAKKAAKKQPTKKTAPKAKAKAKAKANPKAEKKKASKKKTTSKKTANNASRKKK